MAPSELVDGGYSLADYCNATGHFLLVLAIVVAVIYIVSRIAIALTCVMKD